ncbi:hypothetical protein BDV28DRAFT_142750 [Aspergillus coremiiformis]|uniref:Transmembrane protein n=1 Tax=Aspergillus coremiiformis TaxID=138285 RepID=A0A5N6YTM9_9EURO|nr:hypothetical protein BDV28DRAFT_142750 [Aspergillus coremiiformis]
MWKLTFKPVTELDTRRRMNRAHLNRKLLIASCRREEYDCNLPANVWTFGYQYLLVHMKSIVKCFMALDSGTVGKADCRRDGDLCAKQVVLFARLFFVIFIFFFIWVFFWGFL